jgi:hypothetical protein
MVVFVSVSQHHDILGTDLLFLHVTDSSCNIVMKPSAEHNQELFLSNKLCLKKIDRLVLELIEFKQTKIKKPLLYRVSHSKMV